MKRTLTCAGKAVSPGETAKAALEVAYLTDGTPIRIPLIIVNGTEDGPVLWMNAVMHGPEIAGYEVLRRLTRELLDPRQLKGAVIASPIVNPLAFQATKMHTPQDEYNLNRVFPGSPTGLLSQRIAHTIVEEGVRLADHVIDLHANPEPSIPFSLVLPGETDAHRRSREMADAFGVTVIEMRFQHEAHRMGTLSEFALSSGRAALAVELIAWRRVIDLAIQVGVRGLLNVMKRLQMIPGEPEPQQGIPIIRGHLTRTEVTANRGGFAFFAKQAGEAVRAGETILILRDGHGDVVEEIASPRDGNILAFPLMNNQAAMTGDFVAFISFPA